MPRHPTLSGPAEALPTSILARLRDCCADYRGNIVPFHIGNSHLSPPVAARLGSLGYSMRRDRALYDYCPPQGDGGLAEALVDKVRRKNGMAFADAGCVQVTCGATHALACSIRAVLDPGDDILLLAPHWPMIRGISVAAGVTPVEVPFVPDADSSQDPGDVTERVSALIEPHITGRSAGLYLCNPNNPTGRVYSAAELRAIARVAERHDLWVISDEVYEEFTYDDHRHESIAGMPGMAGRTLTAFSFSKSYAMAGLRVGYVVGPSSAVAAVRTIANHTVYSVPRAMQHAALAALVDGEDFLARAREEYREARDLAVNKLSLPVQTPQGSTYLFLDLTHRMRPGERDALPVLERLARAGILLVPGHAFGQEFSACARLCFTSVPIEALEAGIDRVNRVLED